MPEEKAFADEFSTPDDKAVDELLGGDTKVEPQEPTEPEADEKEFKNRRMRRMEEKWQAEREANIALNERVKALSEVQKFREESQSDTLDADLSRIYGTDTPQGQEATRILQKVLQKHTKDAEERAYERFIQARQEEEGERAEASQTIDTELESLEDDFNIDLTSNAPAARKARTELLDLVEKLSPKDREGNIVEFADFGAAFELYQSRKSGENSRQKDLGSRSMVRGGSSGSSNLEKDARENYLREIGIL